GDGADPAPTRQSRGNGHQAVVSLTTLWTLLVDPQHPERAHRDDDPGPAGGIFAQDERVERIPVFGARPRDEPPVEGIRESDGQRAAEHHRTELRLPLGL